MLHIQKLLISLWLLVLLAEGPMKMRDSHRAVNEDSQQFSSQRFQQLSIVELTQSNFEL